MILTYEDVKQGYELKIWTKDDVRLAVEKNKITKEQYKIIICEDY